MSGSKSFRHSLIDRAIIVVFGFDDFPILAVGLGHSNEDWARKAEISSYGANRCSGQLLVVFWAHLVDFEFLK